MSTALLLVFVGCGEDSGRVREEREHPDFERGLALKREGLEDRALAAFLRVTENAELAPESHLEAGLLYLNQFENPIEAIHHFNRYLEVKAGGERSREVRELIETAQKRFLASLPGRPYFAGEGTDALELYLERLQAERDALKEELAGARRDYARLVEAYRELEADLALAYEALDTGGELPKRREPEESPLRAPEGELASFYTRPSTFTVRAGDTLSKIATEVYGDSSYAGRIFEANRDLLRSPDAIREGQVLRLPFIETE